MEKNKKILFTFDYELFLGKDSGDVLSNIITPTNKLLTVLSKLKTKGIFFIDATYLYRLIDKAATYEPARKDLESIEKQIAAILSGGNEIGLHVHPHWIDAVYNSGKNTWDLSNNNKFSVSNLSAQEAAQVFNDSYSALSGIIKKFDTAYQIKSFRAGGLCVQPFTDLKPHLDRLGIKYDFSVLSGSAMVMKNYQFNFKGAPEDNFYKFNTDVLVKDKTGEFTEFTIPKLKLSFLSKILNSVYFRLSSFFTKSSAHGLGTAPNIDETESREKTFSTYFKTPAIETLSIENLNITKIFSYLFYIKRSPYVHFISHPKLFRPGQLLLFYFLISITISPFKTSRYDFENW